MELHIKDRLYFPSILPNCQSFLEFNLKRNILKKVAITEADKEKYEITSVDEGIRWNAQVDAETPLVVDFTGDELAFIKKGCEALEGKTGQTYPDAFWLTVENIWNAAEKQ